MACTVYLLFTTYVSLACAKNWESCHGAILWLGKVWRQVQAWAETRGSEWIPNQQDWECWCCSLLWGWGLRHAAGKGQTHGLSPQTLPDAGFRGKRFVPFLGLLLSVVVLSHLLLRHQNYFLKAQGSVSEWVLRDGWWCVLCSAELVAIRVMSSPINSRWERSVVIILQVQQVLHLKLTGLKLLCRCWNRKWHVASLPKRTHFLGAAVCI